MQVFENNHVKFGLGLEKGGPVVVVCNADAPKDGNDKRQIPSDHTRSGLTSGCTRGVVGSYGFYCSGADSSVSLFY